MAQRKGTEAGEVSESRKDKLAAVEPRVAPFPSPPRVLTFTWTEI